jgi:Uma2 family endonuclease
MTALINQFEGTLALSFPSQSMSDDEFFEFCQLNRELKIERTSEGNIIIMSPTGSETSYLNFEFSTELGNWNRQHKLGKAFDSSGGFRLPNGAVYAADAAWVTIDKWKALDTGQRRKFAPLVPDFIMELRSPSDSRAPLQEKIAEFLEQGTRLAWLIDPSVQKTTVYRADGSQEDFGFDQTLSGEDVLPGFEVCLTQLWA